MKTLIPCAVLLSISLVQAQDPPVKEPAIPIEPAKKFEEFSKILQRIVAKQVPREIDERSGWGATIPDPGNLRLSALRTRIKVGDRLELPNGLWKKVNIVLEDPEKNLLVDVKEFRQAEAGKFKVLLDVETPIKADGTFQHWQKGISLLAFNSQADARVMIAVDCDVAVSLNAKVFPPEVVVDPKVQNLKLTIKDFNLIRVGKVLEGENAKWLGDEMKQVLQSALPLYEEEVKRMANDMIARSIKEGKGKISPGELLKLTPK